MARNGHSGSTVKTSSGSKDGDEIRTFRVAATVFQIPSRYQLIRPVGSGAYGVVISALNTDNGKKVAIKKVHRVFEDLVDAKRILREIKLLRRFEHENIINIVDILPPPGSLATWEDLYIVNDLMETDLHRIIYSNQPLSIDHCQYFVYQILRALKYMHSAHVVHRDLKPSNLLLNGNCDLKICDLGLSRGIEGDDTELTEYVVTRWYRAPEIMLACQEYTEAIDVWSVGCIFGELLERRALFPGEDYIDQLRRIVAKLGKPAPEELDFVTSDKARRFILGLPEPPTDHEATAVAVAVRRRPPTAWRAAYSQVDPLAVDLLERMLVFRPADRISVEEALQHPFMAQLHVESDEPRAGFAFDWAYEQAQDLSRRSLQQLVWEEMALFHPECAGLEDPDNEWQGPGGDSGGGGSSLSSAEAEAKPSTPFSPLCGKGAKGGSGGIPSGDASDPSAKEDAPPPSTRPPRPRQKAAVAPDKQYSSDRRDSSSSSSNSNSRGSKHVGKGNDDTSRAKEAAVISAAVAAPHPPDRASQPKHRRSKRIAGEGPPPAKGT